jgi:hypothetical protein
MDVRRLREQAYARQGGLCYWCDRPMLRNAEKSPRNCTAEHLIRSVDGGRTNTINIVAACALCNNTRHTPVRKVHHKPPTKAKAQWYETINKMFAKQLQLTK